MSSSPRPELVAPMWLAHHHDDHLERCVQVGTRAVCRRCLVLYPLAIVVAVAQVAGLIGSDAGLVIMWLAPLPATVEWVGEHLGGWRYSPRRQVLVTAVAAVALGIALGRHARHPFDGATMLPLAVYAVVCLGTWWRAVSAPGSQPDWESDFDRAEAERQQRLAAMIDAVDQPGGGSATKSMSSSTAPTSDGLKSL